MPMNRQQSSNPRRAFGLISYVTPIAVPLFLVFFHAPFIAAPLHASGWNKGAAFVVGVAIPALWLALGSLGSSRLATRFAKLATAPDLLVLGLPMVGIPAIIAWICIRALWH